MRTVQAEPPTPLLPEIRTTPAMISVIVPARNAAATIAETIQSLSVQIVANEAEIVVADNGSTDDTRTIVERLAHASPFELRVVDASARPGASYARSVGAAAARGTHLLFLDADDVVLPGYLAAMTEALTRHPFVHASSGTTLLNPAWMHAFNRGLSSDTPSTGTWRWALGSTIGIRRDVYLRSGGWNPDVRRSEDADLSWRLRHTNVDVTAVPDARVEIRLRSRPREAFVQALGYGFGATRVNRAWARHGLSHDSDRDALRRGLGAIAAGVRSASTPAGRHLVAFHVGLLIGRLGTRAWDAVRRATPADPLALVPADAQTSLDVRPSQ